MQVDLTEVKLLKKSFMYTTRDIVPETIDSGPMCITDLFQNKSVAYFDS